MEESQGAGQSVLLTLAQSPNQQYENYTRELSFRMRKLRGQDTFHVFFKSAPDEPWRRTSIIVHDTLMDENRLGVRSGERYLIGGGLKVHCFSEILHHFLEACGGTSADIKILPTALEGSGGRLKRTLCEIGAASVEILPVYELKDCNNPEILRSLQSSSGIFIGGGDPKRLAEILPGTELARLVCELHLNGVPVAGSSSGASIMCNEIIVAEVSKPSATQSSFELFGGISVLANAIVETHFNERNRWMRLLTALARCSADLGIGVDEDTAAIITHNGCLEVIGSGATTIFRKSSDAFEARCKGVMHGFGSMRGIEIELLSDGMRTYMGKPHQ